MSSNGKYVRAPEYHCDSEDSNDSYGGWLPSGRSMNETDASSSPCSLDTSLDDAFGKQPGNEDIVENDDRAQDAGESINDLRSENQEYMRRMDQLKSTLDKLVEDMATRRPLDKHETSSREVDESGTAGEALAGPPTSTGGIRWENIQPFPDDVPANMMWEQWNRFIDRFEIAVSISNITDPVKRSQILFLSLGEKLQGIARAARLRPNLREPNCYKTFVNNIETFLQSMVDTTAEHETFSNLKQGSDELAITFHARLLEKVRLCKYSSADEDQFVRMQLLKGLRNRELAKTARTFGYDRKFIVQAATREETFVSEAVQAEPPEAFVVARNQQCYQYYLWATHMYKFHLTF